VEVARRPVEANTPGRKVDLRENSAHISKPEKKTTTRMAEAEPPQVRTVLPEVAIINPELSYSLQPPNEAISGPDSAEGTATAAAPRAVTRVRVGSEAQAAKLVYQPKPEYPALAKSARVQGAVRLEVVVAKDGTVEKLRVLSGHPMLVEAAEAAVERWRYEPTVLNGNPIEVVTEVDVDFAF
jgi:TonB family protein